jgi:gluconolactonase
MRLSLLLVGLVGAVLAQEPEFPLTADSKVQEGVAKGTMVKGEYVAGEESVFPGTVREYQLYLPAGFDKAKPAAFMVFQDGVIYQAPVVFDNLIANGDVPPMVGVFMKPGVVPAANENALPRFNRSFEYDSVTPLYSRFLIEEFLPAVEQKHGITFSTNPNEAAIAGNSSGGICAFMVAWHRPDRFRRVFTGVGTYVGIHGADQLPVWVRKFEPKPIRVFLQSGTGDNNLYCGDWWMANQMMERSLSWAGYEVKHAWGEGGHNQKHASQVFPEAMRWLWREWKTEMEVKANVKGDSKWKGYEVVGEGEAIVVVDHCEELRALASDQSGEVTAIDYESGDWWRITAEGEPTIFSKGHKSDDHGLPISRMVVTPDGKLVATGSSNLDGFCLIKRDGRTEPLDFSGGLGGWSVCVGNDGWFYMGRASDRTIYTFAYHSIGDKFLDPVSTEIETGAYALALSPDQTLLYATNDSDMTVRSYRIDEEHRLTDEQVFFVLEAAYGTEVGARGLCVDQGGRLYVATALGVQVCDQAGRVNFIIPTPKPVHDVCFGGKDLGELFIACGDTVYKRATKARGVVSGQMAPIKPAPPKL